MAESPSFFQAFGPSMERLKSARTPGKLPSETKIPVPSFWSREIYMQPNSTTSRQL